jgi:hypothetical protein
MAARQAARAEATAHGRTPRNPFPAPAADPMGAAGKITRVREENRRRLAATEMVDAEPREPQG